MAENGWLTKSEVNSLYYNTVAGEISFVTEASVGGHPFAIARLIEHQAADVGRQQIRILEIGANECGFARALINEIGIARANRRTEIERVDYLAVEYARPALEAVATWGEEYGYFDRVVRGPAGQPTPLGEPPPRPAMVALAVINDELNVNLGLVHAEANQFVRANTRAVRLHHPQRAPRRHALPRLLRRRRGPALRGRPGRARRRRALDDAGRGARPGGAALDGIAARHDHRALARLGRARLRARGLAAPGRDAARARLRLRRAVHRARQVREPAVDAAVLRRRRATTTWPATTSRAASSASTGTRPSTCSR